MNHQHLPQVVSRFSWSPVKVGPEWIDDALGGRCKRHFFGGGSWADDANAGAAFEPHASEDIFEWQAMLEAVLKARDHFTMVELGCGFGRWLVFAALALRQAHPGMPSTLVGVEAEPTHFAWAQEHGVDNEVQMRLIHAAVDRQDGESEFLVGNPGGWYGQCLANPDSTAWLREHDWDFDVMKVPVVSLSSVLAGLEHIDFIDSDIQGTEADVFEAAESNLDAKVASVFIETHNLPVEERLRTLFGRLGWSKHADYTNYQKQETPYGALDFVGGLQVWHNPRFS